MICPACENKLRVQTTAETKGRKIRVLKCNHCSRKFVTEEKLYHVSTEKAQELKREADHLNYEKQKARGLFETRVTISKPKQKKKVAPKPKPIDPDKNLYLTYDDLIEIFREQNPDAVIDNYRPYPFIPYSIIVWIFDKETSETKETAFQYKPESCEFVKIENCKTYRQILECVGGKRA